MKKLFDIFIIFSIKYFWLIAGVAKLVDALDLGSSEISRESSSLSIRKKDWTIIS